MTEHEHGPCRYCGTESYRLDAEGAWAHPCCVYWCSVRGSFRCPACAASAVAELNWHSHGRQWARRVRKFWAENTPPAQ